MTQPLSHDTAKVKEMGHATRWSVDASGQLHKRDDLQPILNMDELRAYADLGDQLLPDSGITSQWFARQLLAHPRAYHGWQVAQMCEELTDDIPRYAFQWRQPFVDLRNRVVS